MATLTLEGAKGVLARRLGPWVALADLDEAICSSLRELGLSTLDATKPSDADLAILVSAQLNQFYDVAYERGLRHILVNLDPVQLTAAGIKEDPAKIEARLSKRLNDASRLIEKAYGIGLSTLTAGVIEMDFAAQNDTRIPPGS